MATTPEQLQEFLSRGGKIERVAEGVSTRPDIGTRVYPVHRRITDTRPKPKQRPKS